MESYDEMPLPPVTYPAATNDSTSSQGSKRRRFQVPITRYFDHTNTSSSTGTNITQADRTLSPPLPDSVQSSLLTVGMRIRKSVPEGYKTVLAKAYEPQYSALVSANAPQISAELAPFCGLHKIGGLAVQPIPRTATTSVVSSAQSSITLSAIDQEDPFSLPSSQESSYSNSSNMDTIQKAAGKRGFYNIINDEENSEDDNELPGNHLSQMTDTSLSYPFSHTQVSANTRPIAQARSRRQPYLIQSHSREHKDGFEVLTEGLPSSDQENMIMHPFAVDLVSSSTREHRDFDFEEAAFLKRREDVEMGDVL